MNSRLAAILVAFAVLSGCAVDLQHGLPEQDANDIYVLLTEYGISARKVKEEGGNEPTFMIQVPKQDAAQAAKLLSQYSLPRPRSFDWGDVVSGGGMVPTATEERAKMLHGMAGAVSNALNKVDGVLEARAIVMVPERNDLSQPDKKPFPSASVLVRYRPTLEGRPPLDEISVKRFVATAVEDLRPENVTVILAPATLPTPNGSDESFVEMLGFRISKTSAGNFRFALIGAALIMIAMAFVTVWTMMKSGSSSAPPRARR